MSFYPPIILTSKNDPKQQILIQGNTCLTEEELLAFQDILDNPDSNSKPISLRRKDYD